LCHPFHTASSPYGFIAQNGSRAETPISKSMRLR
jgi:hypothetical protein